MSRRDSRQVSCAKAMMRNRSAQPSERTPASPPWRSMMRPNVFHGTNSMTCANSVLPTFMRYPRSPKPERIANAEFEIQIVDTREVLEPRVNRRSAACRPQINRTLLIQNKVLFILDNDAEGVDALKRLEDLQMPPNMRAIVLPDHEAFRNFPAIGPEGTRNADINGRAAAIECYLDLRLPNYGPPVVRWSNYKKD